MVSPQVTTHAILLDETRKQILLVKQKIPSGQIIWGFPGGHIEVGEKVTDALIREVKEETGYLIEINQLLGVYDNIVKDASLKTIDHLVNIIYMVKIESGTLDFRKDKDIIEAKWISFADVNKLRMSGNAKTILHDALSAL